METLWKLRIPFAIGNLILGCRVSAGLEVIGAIIGEVFVGPGASGFEGLGTLLTAWQNRARTDAIIANIFVSTLLGLVMLGFVNLIANVALKRWTQSRDFEAE